MAIALLGVGLTAASAVPESYENPLPLKDPQSLLPNTSQHVFAPVDPRWKELVSYSRLEPESFVVERNPSAEAKRNLYKEIRYFPDSTNDPNKAVKILTYYPDGKLYSEIDKVGDECFAKHFFSDGTFADFTHWRRGKWIAGVAMNPKTKEENHFSDGSGHLTTYDDVRDISKTTWYQKGGVFLVFHYAKSRRDEIRLYVDNDCMFVLKAEESLYVLSELEIWTKAAGKDEVRRVLIAGHPSLGMSLDSEGTRDRKQIEWSGQELLRVWKEDRRPQFVKRYTEVLRSAGQSWKNLGIEFIRDSALWPES